VVSQIGERLYDLFFKKYSEKQWQKNPDKLAPELAGRIPIRYDDNKRYFNDTYEGIPIHGYTELVKNMIDHPNIVLDLNCDFHKKKNFANRLLTVYTGELDKFFNYKYGKLDYRSVKIEFKTIDQKYFQPVAVVNYPNDYDYTRITEFKHMTQECSEKTTICYEYPSSEGIPFYTVPDKRNNELREKYMSEVSTLEKEKTVLFIGRLAEYKYYNMDSAIESAIIKINSWLKEKQ
jgi:UDP-galactopyranose mutase